MEKRTKDKLIIIATCVAFTIFIVITIILAIINSKKTATLSTKIVPFSATITIDGKKYHPNKDYHLEPGTTSIIISANGYKTQELPLNLSDNETTTITAALTPDDGDTSSYCAAYNNECQLFEEIMQIQSSQASEEYFKKYPIATMLPVIVVDVDPTTYEWMEYRIDGGNHNDCKNDYCVIITDSTGGNQEKALQKIRDQGFNPNDYEIIYKYVPITPLK